MHDLANVYQKVNNYSFIVVFGSKQKLPRPILHFLKNYGTLLHNCLIFISNMPHNGFIYEAWMDMMENSGHCVYINIPRVTDKNMQKYKHKNIQIFKVLQFHTVTASHHPTAGTTQHPTLCVVE